MEKLAVFEDVKIQIITDENDEPLFELYSTGMALGYVKSNGKSKGVQSVHPEEGDGVSNQINTVFPFKSRIDTVAKNAEIKPIVLNENLYINESQLYDFMLESRTAKCRAFRKWVVGEVLPSIRKTGKYEHPAAAHSENKEIEKLRENCKHLDKKQIRFLLNYATKLKQEELTKTALCIGNGADYKYIEKTLDGEVVLTISDVTHFLNLSDGVIIWCLEHSADEKVYHELFGHELRKFANQNPDFEINKAKRITIITEAGFKEICKTYGFDFSSYSYLFVKSLSKRVHVVVDEIRELQQSADVLIDKLEKYDTQSKFFNGIVVALYSLYAEILSQIYKLEHRF